MKAAFKTLLCLSVVFAAALVVNAEEGKEKAKTVTLKGDLGCAKCVFKVEGCKVCTNAIQVKEDGKEVVYIIDDGGKKQKYHKDICTGKKKGSVTGTVSKKDGKLYIKPEKGGVKLED
jgi:hypothetical protein